MVKISARVRVVNRIPWYTTLFVRRFTHYTYNSPDTAGLLGWCENHPIRLSGGAVF